MKVEKFNNAGQQERIYKAKMALNGLTLAKISKKLGYSLPYIQMIITGKRSNEKVIRYLKKLPGKLEV